MPDAFMPSAKVRTYTGQLIDLLQPELTVFRTDDIVVPLSRLCRFAGASREFYSVAEHCVQVSMLTEQLGGDPWAGLWHDAAEAFVGDLTSPLKAHIFKYGQIERRILCAMADQFGFVFQAGHFQPEVEEADKLLVDVEGLSLVQGWQSERTPRFQELTKNVRLMCLSPAMAAAVFVARLNKLAKDRGEFGLLAVRNPGSVAEH